MKESIITDLHSTGPEDKTELKFELVSLKKKCH